MIVIHFQNSDCMVMVTSGADDGDVIGKFCGIIIFPFFLSVILASLKYAN